MDRKLITVAISVMLLPGLSTAESWDIEPVEQPYILENISNSTTTIQAVNITDSDTDVNVNQSILVGESMEYEYNETMGELKWLKDGIWYAEFDGNLTDDTVNFTAYGDVMTGYPEVSDQDAPGVYHERTLNVGEMQVEILNNQYEDVKDISTTLNAGEEMDIRVNVTDDEGNFESDAVVTAYFSNITDTTKEVEFSGTLEGEYHYEPEVEIPEDMGVMNFLHVKVEHEENPGYDAFGSTTIYTEILPLEGEIQQLDSDIGCDESSFFEACEVNATVDTGFNVTSENAEGVNLSLQLEDNDKEEWTVHNEWEMTEEEDNFYEQEIEIPDMNTSNYTNSMRLNFHAYNGTQTFDEYYGIDYESFKIEDRTSTQAYQGTDHTIELLVAKPFSDIPHDHDRFKEGQVNITGDGYQMTNFSFDEMEREGDNFVKDISIPSDANETYWIDVSLTNIYNYTVEEQDIGVLDIDETDEVPETFELEDESIDLTVSYPGNYSEEVGIENTAHRDINLTAEVSDSLENVTETLEDFEINESETGELELEFDVEEVEEIEGNITFQDGDTGFEQVLDIEIGILEHDIREGDLAVLAQGDDWLEVSLGEDEETTEDVDLYYLGENLSDINDTVDVNISSEGNITDYLEHETEIEMNNSQIVEFDYSSSEEVYAEGNITFEKNNSEIVLNTSLKKEEIDEDTIETGISLPFEIDLGYFPSGETVEADIEVENTGDEVLEITGFDSDEYSVSGEEIQLSTGETDTLEVEFESVDTESGDLTIEAESDGENLDDSISVIANLMDDFDERIQQVQDDIIDYTAQTSNQEIQSQLQDLELEISDAESEYDSENYEEAQSKIESIESQIDNIATQIQQEGETNGQEDDNGFTQDPGEEIGSDIPWLPIGIFMIVLMVIAFVAYESIIPEEGDPLYGVLGK